MLLQAPGHVGLSGGRQQSLVEQFCAAGFAWVTVDVRGTGASQGSRPSGLHPEEIQDLLEMAQWVLVLDSVASPFFSSCSTLFSV